MQLEKINEASARIVQKYKTQIFPSLVKHEVERKQYVKQIISTAVMVAIIFVAVLLVVLFLNQPNAIIAITGVACAAVVMCGLVKAIRFVEDIKREIMLEFCTCFESLSWDGNFDDTETNKLFEESNLFCVDSTSRFRYDDVFHGGFDNVPFSVYELESYTIHTRRVNGRTVRHKKIEFKGVVVKVKMNKNFTGNTVIKPHGSLNHAFGWNLKRTKLEDVEFEKKFNVYTTDEIEARYLITTSFMERIKNIQTAFSINRVSCAFYEDYILLGLHTYKNLFEPLSLFKPFTDYTPFSTMSKEILSIYKLIDHFKLNEKTGL